MQHRRVDIAPAWRAAAAGSQPQQVQLLQTLGSKGLAKLSAF
jgi:hypothetical protein